MLKSFRIYWIATLAVAAILIIVVCIGVQKPTASAGIYDKTDASETMSFENVSDIMMTDKEIAEQKALEKAEAEAQETERLEKARVQAAMKAASEEEERRAHAAVEQAEAKKEAEREASTSEADAPIVPQISYTPGEGDYADVLMIGDSIMVFTSDSLYEYLPGVTIDACSARSLETGGVLEGSGPYDGILDHVRALDPSQFSRYVIGTGNNDWNGMDLDSGEEIVACLADKQIWFVTEYVSNNTSGTNNTNATIEELCSKYPNVHKIDWYALASANQEAFLQGDNCHPQTQESHDAYAGLVKAALDQ